MSYSRGAALATIYPLGISAAQFGKNAAGTVHFEPGGVSFRVLAEIGHSQIQNRPPIGLMPATQKTKATSAAASVASKRVSPRKRSIRTG